MTIIETLVDRMDDEIDGAKRYTELAHKYKMEYPRLADKFIELAEAELSHLKVLHAEAARMIENIKETKGEPPADMMAIYNYEHRKQIERVAKIRQMIAEYKNA